MIMKQWNWLTPTGTQSKQPASMLSPFSYFQEMDRFFEQACKSFGMGSLMPSVPGLTFSPTVNIASTQDAYHLEVELPGLSENDLRITVSGAGELCICGEKRLENENQEKNYHRIERSYGQFTRTLTLPEDADFDQIEARVMQGILSITVPRLEQQASQQRRIEVQIEGDDAGKRGNRQNERRDMRPERSERPERPERQERSETRQDASSVHAAPANANPKRVA